MKKFIFITALLMSLTAQAEEVKKVYTRVSNNFDLVITNQACKLGTRTDNQPLFEAYVTDITNGAVIEEGCWFPEVEVIHVIFPPVGNLEALELSIEASHFQPYTSI